MALKDIQLCNISPLNRAEGQFEVVAYSDDQAQQAQFVCDSEHDALRLRTAIREHASRLRRVADYRPERPPRAASAMKSVLERDHALMLSVLKELIRTELFLADHPQRIEAYVAARVAVVQATRSAA